MFTLADAVAVAVAAAAAAATAFAATVSLPLFLCRLQEHPHCPGGTGFPGQKIQKLGKREGACGIATLGHRRDQEWQGSAREAGGAGPGVRGRSRGGQLRVREFRFPLLGPSFLAGPPTRGRSPGGRPRR